MSCDYLLATLLERLDAGELRHTSVLPWGLPIPFFGRIESATVATLGLNPSSREFTTAEGTPLPDFARRLPTLESVGIDSWAEVTGRQIRALLNECATYFQRNPYARWFNVLERALAPAGVSFYGEVDNACHLDISPYATTTSWGSLPRSEEEILLKLGRDGLGRALRDSRVRLLVLNGAGVVKSFEGMTESRLGRSEMAAWALPRSGSPPARGIAYSGNVSEIGGVALDRRLRVVGFNHNLQSSFGVTTRAVEAIGEWIAEQYLHTGPA